MCERVRTAHTARFLAACKAKCANQPGTYRKVNESEHRNMQEKQFVSLNSSSLWLISRETKVISLIELCEELMLLVNNSSANDDHYVCVWFTWTWRGRFSNVCLVCVGAEIHHAAARCFPRINRCAPHQMRRGRKKILRAFAHRKSVGFKWPAVCVCVCVPASRPE